MELQIANTYIFRGKKAKNKHKVFKGKVIELTDSTIKINNLDYGKEIRNIKERFNENWEAIELTEKGTNKLVERIKSE